MRPEVRVWYTTDTLDPVKTKGLDEGVLLEQGGRSRRMAPRRQLDEGDYPELQYTMYKGNGFVLLSDDPHSEDSVPFDSGTIPY